MLAGAIAGVPVSVLATPTELLKCRLQAQGSSLPPPGAVYSLEEIRAGKALFRGPVQVMQHVLRYEGGPLALFRGFVPTLLREVPGNAGERRMAASCGRIPSRIPTMPACLPASVCVLAMPVGAGVA